MSEIQSENHRKTDIKSMDLAELKAFMTSIGEKPFRASQIYQWMHVRHVSSWDEMTNLSKALREKLKEQAELTVLEPVTIQTSKLDGTKKYLFRLPDGNMIESVLMRYKHGNSVCISSQAGCRMGCRFCASTLDGLVRGLTPAEMLEQIYRVGEDIGERISNVVVMGTGEPLDNYENLLRHLPSTSIFSGTTSISPVGSLGFLLSRSRTTPVTDRVDSLLMGLIRFIISSVSITTWVVP